MAQEKGKVFIASMNMRGSWAKRPDNCDIINVTSMQSKQSSNRRDFSPMTESSYKGFYNFEAFWQSGKVFKDIPEIKTKAYWQGIKEAKRRMPGTKGKEVLYASWPDYGAEMDYVTSRKKVYVPLYHEMMIHTESAEMHKQRVENGTNVVIYDFDGPRLEDGSVTCLEVTEELLREKINDVRFPFGHGYIVAAHLAGISLDKFIAA